MPDTGVRFEYVPHLCCLLYDYNIIQYCNIVIISVEVGFNGPSVTQQPSSAVLASAWPTYTYVSTPHWLRSCSVFMPVLFSGCCYILSDVECLELVSSSLIDDFVS